MSTNASITAVCQKANYGVQKPHFRGNKALTKSAQHLKFDARDLGFIIKSDNTPDKGNNNEAKQAPTTIAYKATTSIDNAIRFLNKVDQSTKTSDYMKKATAYNEQKALVLKAIDPNDLEGAGRLKYWNALKAHGFVFYTVQYTITIEDNNGNKRVTESRRHYRTTKLTEAEFLRSLGMSSAGEDDPEAVQDLEKMDVEATSNPTSV